MNKLSSKEGLVVTAYIRTAVQWATAMRTEDEQAAKFSSSSLACAWQLMGKAERDEADARLPGVV